METDDWLVRKIPAHMRAFVVLSASILLMFTLGIVYTFGKLPIDIFFYSKTSIL